MHEQPNGQTRVRKILGQKGVSSFPLIRLKKYLTFSQNGCRRDENVNVDMSKK